MTRIRRIGTDFFLIHPPKPSKVPQKKSVQIRSIRVIRVSIVSQNQLPQSQVKSPES